MQVLPSSVPSVRTIFRPCAEPPRSIWKRRSTLPAPTSGVPACRQYPKPIQTPHPPIIFGGESNAALGRVADIGQGWYGFNLEPDEFAARLSHLEGLLAERNRVRGDVEVIVSPYLKPCDFDALQRYRDAGADQVVLLAFARGPDDLRKTLEDLAETYVEPARRL